MSDRNESPVIKGNRYLFKMFFALLLFFFILIPVVMIGFDPHHDGLILNTIGLTKSAIREGTPLPFNQYGVFWSILMALLTWPFDASLTLVVLRIFTVIFYVLSVAVLLLIAQELKLDFPKSKIVLVALFSQPWTSGLISTFLPWPSALSGLLLSLLTLAVLRSLSPEKESTYLLLSGGLIGVLLFTRAQLGIFAFFAIIFLLIYLNKVRSLFLVFLGLIFFISLFCSFLLQNGWIIGVFQDFIFGFTYIKDEYGVNPKPIGTLVVFLFTIAFLFFVEKHSSRMIQENVFINAFLRLVSIVILALVSINVVVFDFVNFISRRILIGSFLGIIVFSIFKLVLKFGKQMFFGEEKRYVVLIFFSLVSLVQIYPQFDQTHFWWAMFPGLLFVCLGVSQLSSRMTSRFLLTQKLTFSVICLCILVIPYLKSLRLDNYPYPGKYISSIFVNLEGRDRESSLQNFFHKNIKPQSRVLNLCHNSNVFFDPELALPSSRYFVYWPPFIENRTIDSEILRMSPDVIVTCDQSQVLAAKLPTLLHQKKLINQLGYRYERPKNSILIQNTTWRIY